MDPIEELESIAGLLKTRNPFIYDAVDRITILATFIDEINGKAIDNSRISFKFSKNDKEHLYVVPHAVGSFRSILARFGAICDYTKECERFPKWILIAGRRALNRPDPRDVNRPNSDVIYLKSQFVDIPGSPLYCLDGVLTVKRKDGLTCTLQIKMENTGISQTLNLIKMLPI